MVRRSTQNPYKKLKQTAIQLMQLGILYIYEASHGLLKTLIEQTKNINIHCVFSHLLNFLYKTNKKCEIHLIKYLISEELGRLLVILKG